jgi:hypothetical protein
MIERAPSAARNVAMPAISAASPMRAMGGGRHHAVHGNAVVDQRHHQVSPHATLTHGIAMNAVRGKIDGGGPACLKKGRPWPMQPVTIVGMTRVSFTDDRVAMAPGGRAFATCASIARACSVRNEP